MANKKELSQAEKDAIQEKKDKFIEMLQSQSNGTDDLTLGKVFDWIKLLIESEGYQKKKE